MAYQKVSLLGPIYIIQYTVFNKDLFHTDENIDVVWDDLQINL